MVFISSHSRKSTSLIKNTAENYVVIRATSAKCVETSIHDLSLFIDMPWGGSCPIAFSPGQQVLFLQSKRFQILFYPITRLARPLMHMHSSRHSVNSLVPAWRCKTVGSGLQFPANNRELVALFDWQAVFQMARERKQNLSSQSDTTSHKIFHFVWGKVLNFPGYTGVTWPQLLFN